MLRKLLSWFSSNERYLRRAQPIVEQINALEPGVQKLTQSQMQAKTEEYRERIAEARAAAEEEWRERAFDEDEFRQKVLEAEERVMREILPEAFALVREASVRTIGLRHFDVQLIGGVVLHEGKIAEMKTGEGKTLVATLPLYLNALAGRGAHLVTVNDYLARRDRAWMGPIYEYLGLSVGVIQHEMNGEQRREAYNCDITYITNHEIGFDYLRDNYGTKSLDQLVLRELHYAIIDEVDSILVDEARVPLIISGPAGKPAELYYEVDRVVSTLQRGEENKETHETTGDFIVDEKAKNATLTEEGQAKVERMLGVDNLNDPKNIEINHCVQAALKARYCYRRDVDYVVKDGEVIIVDEFTGRLMPGRRWSDGLHQAVEAKERVRIQEESQTLATITYQNFFRMYDKLAGMTGTAKTEEGEFVQIYGMEVIVVPTNKPCIRRDHPDIVYKTEEQKFRGIIYEILETHARQQPILVGTRNIEVSERLSARTRPDKLRMQLLLLLIQEELQAKQRAKEIPKKEWQQYRAAANRRLEDMTYAEVTRLARKLGLNPDVLAEENMQRLRNLFNLDGESEAKFCQALEVGIPHNVLNAKYHEQEARIVAQAGRKGAVTIATNMAGRGTDILLGGNPEFLAREEVGEEADEETYQQALAKYRELCAQEHEEVVRLGGLHIIGTERHESRRIDNQLRGRSGRQGDPGSSRFYVSLEDELMRLFGPQRWGALMNMWPEEEPVEANLVTKSLENAQAKVEGRNFEIRKYTLLYDDVMNMQRTTIYSERRRILEGADLRETVLDMLAKTVDDALTAHVNPDMDPEEWELGEVYSSLSRLWPLDEYLDLEDLEGLSYQELRDLLIEVAHQAYVDKEAELGEAVRDIERYVMLEAIDSRWRDHLAAMDYLREGINLRAYGQRNPVDAYREEGYNLFQGMMRNIREDVVRMMFSAQVQLADDWARREELVRQGDGQGRRPRRGISGQAVEEQERGLLAPFEVGAGPLPALDALPSQNPEPFEDREQKLQPVRVAQKVGRNDPCPCGSGKKYKKCCGRRA